jgi:hypothetical protein
MWFSPAVTVLCAAALVAVAASQSRAQYAAQSYPYCALSPASGATTCYFRSRAECGSSCISNPWYIGESRAAADTPDRARHGRRHLRPGTLTPASASVPRHAVRRHSIRQLASVHL